MDSIEIGLSRAASVDRCDCIIFLRFTQSNSGWNFLFSIDWPLCGIDNRGIFSIFPNHCNRLVLQSISIITEYQTNDGESAITLFSLVLATDWTLFIICKYKMTIFE